MELGGLLLLLIVLGIYFLPSMCAAGKRGAAGIFVLNLFLGWTLIGWVVAFSWALAAPKDAPAEPGHNLEGDDRVLIRVRPTEGYELAWQNLRVGMPVRIVRVDAGWEVETEDGRLAQVKPEGAKRISFRAEAVGKPRARITEVGTPEEPYANVTIDFVPSAA